MYGNSTTRQDSMRLFTISTNYAKSRRLKTNYSSTCLGRPRRERPPAVCGHFVNVPTHFKVKLPVISGHLPNADADSHLLVVSTCYNGQCKTNATFSVVISTKNRWRAPKLATDRSLKFPCCRLVII